VELGTNELVGDDLERVALIVERIVSGEWKKGIVPPLWDGHAAVRLVDSIETFLR
jgi:UDP-N-acetylglucosamine 2-epimerase (non-hydrolysing)